MPGQGMTLVCGGGGVWGVAWMTGVAMGLLDAGINLSDAAAMVGTSAGSVVSAQLSSGLLIADLFERQTNPARQPREPAPAAGSMDRLLDLMQRSWRNDRERVRAFCELALQAETISPAGRRANIITRLGLPGPEWPQKPLSITAVDTETMELVVFTARSSVPLVDAVAASCAVPGVWPPTPIEGRRYVDGGVWRTENAHLAQGSKAALVLAPFGRVAGSARDGSGLDTDVAQLEEEGTLVVVISADEAALQAMAPGALDPATRMPAAEAGRKQGQREAAKARKAFDLLR